MKRRILVRFVDFWDGYVPQEHSLYKALQLYYDVELSKDPDYVFYSNFGDEHLNISNKCVKIYYTCENLVPDFNLCDYAMAYDWINYEDRYLRFPIYLDAEYADAFQLMKQKHLNNTDTILKKKNSFCSFVYSNQLADKMRVKFCDLLSQYKQISSGGKFMNNVGGPVLDKVEFESRHKFSIAFENSSHSGYTTEKLVQSFAAKTIPIYWGDPNVGKVFNKNAFINVLDYPDLNSVIAKIHQIDEDDDLWKRMLSEPALLNTNYSLDDFIKELSSFLKTIIDQPKKECYRFNRTFWGERYVDKYRTWYNNGKLPFVQVCKNRIVWVLKNKF